MSEKLTAEEYKEKYKHRTAFGVYALDFVNLLTYKQLVEKEAVEKFVDDLVAFNNLLSRDHKNISDEAKIFLNTLIEKYVSNVEEYEETRKKADEYDALVKKLISYLT